MPNVKCPAIYHGRTQWNQDSLLVCGVDCPLGLRESYMSVFGVPIFYCSRDGVIPDEMWNQKSKRTLTNASKNILILPTIKERPVDTREYGTPAQVIDFVR